MYYPDYMLPTELFLLNLSLPIEENDLIKVLDVVKRAEGSESQENKPFHLFLASKSSERPINDGDWYLNKWGDKVQLLKCVMQSDLELYAGENFKVEATTLKKLGIPLIPTSFIDSFIAQNGDVKPVCLECMRVNPDSEVGRTGQKLIVRTCSDRTVLIKGFL